MKLMIHTLSLALTSFLFSCNDDGTAGGPGAGGGSNSNGAGAAYQSRASKFLVKARTYSRDALSTHLAADRQGGERGENVSEKMRETVDGGREENYGGSYGENAGSSSGAGLRPAVQPVRPEPRPMARPLLLD